MDVASHEGFVRNPALIHSFYNGLRRQLLDKKPNAAHLGLKELEKDFDVRIITQNVDDLHERAGSIHVLHLHGELMKVRSMTHEERVFFQEAVPNFDPAVKIAQEADIFVVIGTSLNVYPAAGLLFYAPKNAPIYYIDPRPAAIPEGVGNVTVIAEPATVGVRELIKKLKNQ